MADKQRHSPRRRTADCKLTAVEVAKISERGRYADGGGLYLQVSEWGTKAWVFRYMVDGKSRTMGLGDCSTFSLKEARERARTQRQLLADGIDPLGEREKKKTAAKLEAAKTITFEDAAEKYIKAHAPGWKNAKHSEQWRNTLATYAYPVFNGIPVSAIDTTLVLNAVEPIWTKKSETASRVRGRIEAVLDWAAARGYRSGENPARWKGHLSKLLPAKTKVAKVRHQPALPYGELPEFMATLRPNSSISARALEFTILCATRTSETILATWNEFDLDAMIWTIPGDRTKSGRLHRVPLSDRAVELLKSIPRVSGSTYVFPGAKEDLQSIDALIDEALDDMAKAIEGMKTTR